MAIEPVKIPQNVYVEDRIIGPVTLRQIMIVMGSSGLSYAIWAMMQTAGMDTGVHTFFAWTPTMIGIAFAFIKINGISLFRILLLLIERIDKPARRVWMPRTGIYVNIITTNTNRNVDQKTHKGKAHEKKSQIEELSRVLDEGPKELAEASEVKPVQPNRVQASRIRKPVSDIQKPIQQQGTAQPIIRDISPPPHSK